METLLFAVRYVYKNKKKIAIKLPLRISSYDSLEQRKVLRAQLKTPAWRQKLAGLRQQGYTICYAEYDRDTDSVKGGTPLQPTQNTALNSYVRLALTQETTYSIYVPSAQEKPLSLFKKGWQGIASIPNKIFGGLLGRTILKAQTMDFSLQGSTPKEAVDIFIYENKSNIHAKRIKVFTKDKSELDTLELHLPYKNKKTKKQDRIYIINVVGYDMCYQQKLGEMKNDLLKLKKEGIDAHIIGFNFRNVADSKGKVQSENDLILDVKTQVKRLRDKGVPAENIVIKGYSLGAGISAKAVKELHDEKTPVNLFHSRSFKRISSAVSGWIRAGKKNGVKDRNPFASFFGKVAEPFIRFGLAASQWGINAEKAYMKIPEANKQYIVVRTPTKKQTSATYDDKTITHAASLHNCNSLKLLRKKDKTEKARAKERKMIVDETKVPQCKTLNGHTAPMNALINSKGKTANYVFRQFVSGICKKNHSKSVERNEKRVLLSF